MDVLLFKRIVFEVCRDPVSCCLNSLFNNELCAITSLTRPPKHKEEVDQRISLKVGDIKLILIFFDFPRGQLLSFELLLLQAESVPVFN